MAMIAESIICNVNTFLQATRRKVACRVGQYKQQALGRLLPSACIPCIPSPRALLAMTTALPLKTRSRYTFRYDKVIDILNNTGFRGVTGISNAFSYPRG